jgi:hypothetical protein
MTEISDQRSVVRNRGANIMSEDAGYPQRFPCAVFATVVKPISDLRLLISGLFVLLLALSFPAQAQQPKKAPRIGLLISAFSLSLPADGGTQLAR